MNELETVYIAGSDGRDHFYGLFPKKVDDTVSIDLTKSELSNLIRVLDLNNTYGGYQSLLNKLRKYE